MGQPGFLQRNCMHRAIPPPPSPLKSGYFWGGTQEMLNRERQTHARAWKPKAKTLQSWMWPQCERGSRRDGSALCPVTGDTHGAAHKAFPNHFSLLWPLLQQPKPAHGDLGRWKVVQSPWLEIQPSAPGVPCSLTATTSAAAARLAAGNLDLHLGARKAPSKLTQFTHTVKSGDTAV